MNDAGRLPGPKPDVGTQLAYERTDLALDRTYLASDRTLMAWIRTALSMISFGFTIGKLDKVLQDVQIKGLLGINRNLSGQTVAYFLVVIGTAALIVSAIQHWRRTRALEALGLKHEFSITLIVAVLLSAVGGFALASMLMSL